MPGRLLRRGALLCCGCHAMTQIDWVMCFPINTFYSLLSSENMANRAKVPVVCSPMTPSNDFWEGTFSSSRYRAFGFSFVCGDLSFVIPRALPDQLTEDLILVTMQYRGVLGRGERYHNVRCNYMPPPNKQPSSDGIKSEAEMWTKIIPFKKPLGKSHRFVHRISFFNLSRQGDSVTGLYMLNDAEHVAVRSYDCGTFWLRQRGR